MHNIFDNSISDQLRQLGKRISTTKSITDSLPVTQVHTFSNFFINFPVCLEVEKLVIALVFQVDQTGEQMSIHKLEQSICKH